MQLPTEIWRDILLNLPRSCLDDLAVVNRSTVATIRAFSEPNTDGPLRSILINVYECQGTQLQMYMAACSQDHPDPEAEAYDIRYRVFCATPGQLLRTMRDSIVRNAW